MLLRTALASCLVVVSLQSGAHAQQSRTEHDGAAVKNPAGEAEASAVQRQLALLEVRGFAEHFLAFRDERVKVRALARLADVLWQDDEPFARSLFSRSLDLAAAWGKGGAEVQAATRLHREVIVAVARRDPGWAKQLIDEPGGHEQAAGADRMEADYRAASDLLKLDPARSLEFAERSLRDGVPSGLHFPLLQLRLKNEPAASALFLKALERLAAQPAVRAEALLSLGTYVFTSPALPPGDTSIAPDTVRVVGVGRLLVYDITADRPGVPRHLVRAYLRAAAGILARPVTDPDQRAHYYAAARLLTPKTAAYAPELTQAMQGVMQTLSQDVPRELTYDAAYANFAADA